MNKKPIPPDVRPSAARSRRWQWLFLGGVLILGATALGSMAAVTYLGRPTATTPREEQIHGFIESYFHDWSAGDVEGYKNHFDPAATIVYMEKGEVAHSSRRDPFIAQQAQYLKDAQGQMVERMTSLTAEADDAAAQVTAHWELRKPGQLETGVDRFTLSRDAAGNWKIVTLVFYAYPR